MSALRGGCFQCVANIPACPSTDQMCLGTRFQRGEFAQYDIEFGAGSPTDRPPEQVGIDNFFTIVLTIQNCTGCVLSNVSARLQFLLFDPNDEATHVHCGIFDPQDLLCIVSSFGTPNVTWNGCDETRLFGARWTTLPPGTTIVQMYVRVPETPTFKPTDAFMLPGAFSVVGRLDCGNGQCVKIKKSIQLEGDCLPMDAPRP